MKRYWVFVFLMVCPYGLFAVARESIFKDYDIRGIVGEDVEVEDFYDIGCGIATYYHASNQGVKQVVISADGRIHSPAIKQQMIEVFCSR